MAVRYQLDLDTRGSRWNRVLGRLPSPPSGRGQTMKWSFKPHAPLPFDLAVEESDEERVVGE